MVLVVWQRPCRFSSNSHRGVYGREYIRGREDEMTSDIITIYGFKDMMCSEMRMKDSCREITCIDEAYALLKEAKLMKMSALGWYSAAEAVDEYILMTISLVPKNALVVPMHM